MELKKLFISLNPWPRISTCITHCLNRYSQRLWRKFANGELAVNSILRDKRRAEWQQTTRPLVGRVFKQAENDFKKIIALTNGGPGRQEFSGTIFTNLDSCTLTTRREETGITRTPYNLEKTGDTTNLYERWGVVQVCQDHNGLIHIYFYPIELDTEDANMPPRQRLLYGRYEPWDLTEDKLKRAVTRGARILLESRNGSRRSLYSWWVYKKNSQFYRGVMLGVVLSIPGSWLGSGIATIFRSIWTLLCGAY